VPIELPMFPLNTVLFPGVTVPLRVFEERYRALVTNLHEIDDPAERLFGSVAIREGYEVGDHGAQSLFRVGVRLQLTEVIAHADGSFDIVAVARDRIRLNRLRPTSAYPVGEIDLLPDDDAEPDPAVTVLLRSMFDSYRDQVSGFSNDPHPGSLPKDPTWLAWALAASIPLPIPARQGLLEQHDPNLRIAHLVRLLREELNALAVIPSLPASDIARNRWSPN
jgi:Lon protease-like protein